MGAGKALALARVFGSSAALDSYLLAFLAPSFLADVFCGSLVPVLVPRLIELEHREGRAKAADLYAHVLWRSSIACQHCRCDTGGRCRHRGHIRRRKRAHQPAPARDFDSSHDADSSPGRSGERLARRLELPEQLCDPGPYRHADAGRDDSVHFPGWRKLRRLNPGGRNQSGFACGSRGAWLGPPAGRVSDPPSNAGTRLVFDRDSQGIQLSGCDDRNERRYRLHRAGDGGSPWSGQCVDSQLRHASGWRADGDRSRGPRYHDSSAVFLHGS